MHVGSLSISFLCEIDKNHVQKMLLKHQYLKFAYVDIILMISKIIRGNLTAGMLAIKTTVTPTVVLISQIDTNCHTISA